jgi:5-methyltetrahydrofolate--homocysteine methyltransferase
LNAPLLDRPTTYDGSKGVLLAPSLAQTGRQGSDIVEWLNLLSPEAVRACHDAYIRAGSEVIQTNTFNGNRIRLEQHGLGADVQEVNRAGARIAREAAGGGVAVAGSMGPTGKLLVMNEITVEEIGQAFAEQAVALEDGGVDFFHIETMADMGEAVAAVEGIRSVSQLPIALTMSFDSGNRTKGLRTMMGVSATELVQKGNELGLFAVGANCGRGLDGYQQVIEQLAASSPRPALIAKMNAGIPRLETGRLVYDTTADEVAAYARWCMDAGVELIGLCCGGDAEHIKAIASALAP